MAKPGTWVGFVSKSLTLPVTQPKADSFVDLQLRKMIVDYFNYLIIIFYSKHVNKIINKNNFQ